MECRYPTGPLDPFREQLQNLRKFRKRHSSRFKSLTEREQEVLTLLADGLNNPKVAAELDISRTTVQNHRAKIRDKLGVSSQIDFVKFALAYDLIDF